MGIGRISYPGYRDTLDMLIVAFCRDYFARQEVLRGGSSYSRRTRMEYEYVNRRIREAAIEIVGCESDVYIYEIAEKIGYAYSKVQGICEVTYKRKKREVKLNIARKLHLID